MKESAEQMKARIRAEIRLHNQMGVWLNLWRTVIDNEI